MPPAAGILVSIAINLAIAAAFTIISRLLAPQNRATPALGGQLPAIKDPGTQLTLRNAAEPHNIVFGRRRAKGNIVFAHCTGSNAVLHLVVTWAGHPVHALDTLYFNDEIVPLDGSGNATGKYAGYVVCKDHLGAEDQTADTALIAACPDKWTDEHRGRGIAYSYVKLTFSRALFPQGLPNIWRVLEGMEVYDPRDLSTGYSDNAALAVAAWFNSDKFGRGIAYDGLNGIDVDELAAAANICDETVTLASGGSEARYAVAAVLSSDTSFIDNTEKLLSAMAGSATPVGGGWVIQAAAWEAPELVFTEDDLLEPIQVQNGVGNDEAFNAIKGKFANPDKLWQPDDFPAIVSSIYEDEDGGTREFKDVSLDCTPSAVMAQRIARIDLRRGRQPLAFQAKLRLKALRTRPGKNVAFTLAFCGWEEKAFRVEQMKLIVGFAPGAGEGSQPGIIGASLSLRETAEAIYDWDPAIDEQGIDPAPNTTLPNIFNPLPPGTLDVTEELYVTRDGAGVKTRALMAWTASSDAFVAAYRPRWRLSGGDWNVLADVTGLATTVEDLAPGNYEFAVAAVNNAGVASSYVSRVLALTGLLEAPANPSGLTVSAIGGLAILRYDPTEDVDVRIGGKAVFRHSPATSGATWAAATPIGDELPGGDTVAVLPLKAGTYLLKFRDSSGLLCDSPATVVTEQAALTGFTTPGGGSLVEDPTFSGTKTNCSVSSSKLKLTAGQATGSYAFSAKMDLGSVLRVRLTTAIAAQVVNNTDTWDSTELCDSTEMWDGDVTGDEATALVWVRKTNDDPAGTPTWGAWNRLDSAEYEARGFDFRLDLAASDTNYGIEIEELAVVAEEAS